LIGRTAANITVLPKVQMIELTTQNKSWGSRGTSAKKNRIGGCITYRKGLSASGMGH